MLKRLAIYNYAIIDKLEITFSGKLNIITGETGAGKSIIVGALGLILGERADSGVLVNKERKCIVEGVFTTTDKKNVEAFLKEHELDGDGELMVRREITANGKSRAFINDTPVNLSQLQQLSTLLVDLHQQFDTLELGESDFQREVIDALAGNASLLKTYHDIFIQWQQATRKLAELSEQKRAFDREADYNQFQFNELEEAGFAEDELENITGELKLLSNAEEIKNTLSKIYFELEESEAPVVQQVKGLLHQLHTYETFHPGIPAIVERMQSLHIELRDVAGEIDKISGQVSYDPAKIDQLNERLSVGYRLLKKHGVKTTNDLLAIHRELQEKLQAVLNIDESIQKEEQRISGLFNSASELAKKLSAIRHRQVKPLEEKVNKLLTQVGMPNAMLKVHIQPGQHLNSYGQDSIEFLFDANKSGQFQPLRKVASGGELSRLMLCIKSLVAQSIDLPTMIFDEIDTGISGEAARQVGIILKELAARRQIICITHQPQIAGKADAHYFVYKEIQNDLVKTNIRQLDNEERITAIARMLSGEKPTAAALENAREMVGN